MTKDQLRLSVLCTRAELCGKDAQIVTTAHDVLPDETVVDLAWRLLTYEHLVDNEPASGAVISIRIVVPAEGYYK